MAELNNKQQKLFKMKYAINDTETWEQACYRVANYIASAEFNFGKTQEEVDEITSDYYKLLNDFYFLPGGRVLANAGTGIKNLMNCFTLPIEDSRKSIFDTLKTSAEIFANGGGINKNVQSLTILY
jgi:ribonucleoside-diphosphate reductase alpha chain